MDKIVATADITNLILPSAEEVAWALVQLKKRGWLYALDDKYGLDEEGRRVVSEVVGNATNSNQAIERLTKWLSEHPA